ALRPAQAAAREFDRQKNIMAAAGVIQEGDPRPRPELEAVYRERFREHVVELATGELVDDRYKPADLRQLKDARERARYSEVYEALGEDGSTIAWVLPVSGKGLWSILHGFLALDGDGRTVRGITFYEHGETPGLGGEVDNPDWKALWPGKHIYAESGELYGVRVKKGKVNPDNPVEARHYVDGLSGATITGNGVTALVKNGLVAFQPFLEKIKKG
ncbi:MAG TPA: NADH:ubiquinone reductase (Na(+)-transporting) subunit C, partial [Planctomycetota bacterium]|nr:NADH:ubiquinone reductase (Na(+)-transporting) subunit C [Planctomycetota bacterium]